MALPLFSLFHRHNQYLTMPIIKNSIHFFIALKILI